MSTTNFKIFDEGMLNLMSDADYADAIQRLRGVAPGLAVPTLHNKLFLQTSIMCKALADFIVSQGYDALDTNVSVLLTALNNAIIKVAQDNVIAGKNMWTKNTEIAVGDVMYTSDGNGPRWAYLLCTTAGTTGTTEPVIASNVVVGQTIIDNEVTWTIKSVVETIIEFCTQAEAEAGINNTKASTPLRVTQAIAAIINWKPTATIGIGQFRDLVWDFTNHKVILPSGGTWAYFYNFSVCFSDGNSSGERQHGRGTGIAAGGTELATNQYIYGKTGDSGLEGYGGFCWRIA